MAEELAKIGVSAGVGALAGGVAGYFLGKQVFVPEDIQRIANRFHVYAIINGRRFDYPSKPLLYYTIDGTPAVMYMFYYPPQNDPEVLISINRRPEGVYTAEIARLIGPPAEVHILFDAREVVYFPSPEYDKREPGYYIMTGIR